MEMCIGESIVLLIKEAVGKIIQASTRFPLNQA